MDNDTIKYIIARIIENANEQMKEPRDDFNNGKRLAYYEVLDIIKSELLINDQDIKAFGLDKELDIIK